MVLDSKPVFWANLFVRTYLILALKLPSLQAESKYFVAPEIHYLKNKPWYSYKTNDSLTMMILYKYISIYTVCRVVCAALCRSVG